MKKRVTGLLALCMALMMMVTSTVTALADTSTIDSNDVVPFGSISTGGQVLYEGNVIIPKYANADSGLPFFVVSYSSRLPESVQGTYDGIYQYMNKNWNSFAVKCNWYNSVWKKQNDDSAVIDLCQYYENSSTGGSPDRSAFYDYYDYYDYTNCSIHYYYALQLPPINELFSSANAEGYHYFAKQVEGTPLVSSTETNGIINSDTTGIMPVSSESSENGNLIDTIFGSDGNTNVTRGLLLTAERNVFTITFDANGGTIVERGEPQAVAYGLETQATESDTRTMIQLEYGDTLPEAEGLVTREGYTFAGWSTTSNGDVQFRDEAEAPALPHGDEMTLYAQWTQNTTTPSQNRHYTTTNTAESPKTGDVGLLLYGAMAVSSLMGMGYVGKKKF